MNTGSPAAPTEAALQVYLKEFLMDPYVIDLPFPLRYALVHWIILAKRPAKSARAYKTIWTDHGSPLVHSSTNLAVGLNHQLNDPVEIGMAFGSPSAESALEKLLAQGVDEICLLPMFPHAAMATTGGCTALVKKRLKGRATLRVAPPFYDHPKLIDPLAHSLEGIQEYILFSYHGLPIRHLKKQPAPDYHVQCLATTQAVVKKVGLTDDQYSVSFQSRLGRDPWLEPDTEDVLSKLPALGKKKLAVICPSFFCDCLETLEEIELRGRKIFMDAGGESFRMIPCLNDSPVAFQCLETLMAQADDWPIQ